MNSNIIFICGGKGGVGKSLVTCGVLDTLLEQKQEILLIESDSGTPDVYKNYSGIITSALIDLDKKEGWIALLNKIHATNAVVVVNTAPRNKDGMATFSSLLTASLPELDRELITLWVIDRQRAGLELLKDYREYAKGIIHVIRNLHFGSPDQFELFNGSKIKQEIEKTGVIADFPYLVDNITDAMNINRLALSMAGETLQFGERIELQRWRAEVWKTMGKLI